MPARPCATTPLAAQFLELSRNRSLEIELLMAKGKRKIAPVLRSRQRHVLQDEYDPLPLDGRRHRAAPVNSVWMSASGYRPQRPPALSRRPASGSRRDDAPHTAATAAERRYACDLQGATTDRSHETGARGSALAAHLVRTRWIVTRRGARPDRVGVVRIDQDRRVATTSGSRDIRHDDRVPLAIASRAVPEALVQRRNTTRRQADRAPRADRPGRSEKAHVLVKLVWCTACRSAALRDLSP